MARLTLALASTGPGSFWPVFGLSILPYVLAPFLFPVVRREDSDSRNTAGAETARTL
jgi:hypothetical protein